MRYVAMFLAAMLFANNAVAAVRACVAMPQHNGAATAAGMDPACPQSDRTGPCLKHYAQNYQSDETRLWVAFPPLAFAPVNAVAQVSFQSPPQRLVLASASPIVGPPLTILFGNLRN